MYVYIRVYIYVYMYMCRYIDSGNEVSMNYLDLQLYIWLLAVRVLSHLALFISPFISCLLSVPPLLVTNRS